ncbi:MAG: bacterial Ig-like domain-containing protein [Clostridia bacterium]|nr:bacterial Ig-like domain-containing protein [Clostridia bacterium]
MKKNKILSLIIIIILVTILSACDVLSGDKFDFKDYDDFKESVKNYSMTINNNGQITNIKVCENGYLYDNGLNIYFYNAQEEKGYFLDKAEETGVFSTYENGDDLYDWETQGGMIDLLYSFQVLKLVMKKEKEEKVAGRDCTVYSYDNDGSKTKYWLDNEYGMCLKFETTAGEETETMEITEFTINSVTLNNMIDLSNYTIEEGTENPLKTVKSISVNSETVPTGKTTANFALQDITIKVTFDDDSQENKSLNENMLSAQDKAKLETAGTHTITVSYQGKTATFTVTLTDSGQTNSPVVQSINDFYSNIVFNFDTITNGFMTNLALSFSEQTDLFSYYEESIQGRADIEMWSAPNLLRDISVEINAYLNDSFITDEIDFGGGVKKTPSCTATAEGYTVNYTEKKGIYNYWFETEVKYDQTTDSLSAEIYCGVNEEQELNYIIEYNKNADGNYACVIHYPDEIVEGNSQNYSTLKLFFNSISGKASINRLQPEMLDESYLLYEKADNADYANDGDIVLSLNEGIVSCPVDNLTSGFYNDFNALFTTLEANCNSIFDSESEEEKDINFEIDSGGLLFNFEYIYVGYEILPDIIKTYDNKRLIEIWGDFSLIINRTGDIYVITYEDEIVVTVKYDNSDSFCIEKEVNGVIELRLQWVKIDNSHFVEVFNYGEETHYQYKYAFDTEQDIMGFSYIFEIEEVVNLNIYKETELNVATFVQPFEYPYYNYYSYENNILNYECGDGE